MEMDEEAKLIYYSSWLYSATRNLATTPGNTRISVLSKKLGVTDEVLLRVVDFLTSNGLMTKEGDQVKSQGKISHLPAHSPLVIKHHQNWRLQAIRRMEQMDPDNFFLTIPMALSEKHAESLRQELPALVEKITKRLPTEWAETTRCINIDFFDFSK